MRRPESAMQRALIRRCDLAGWPASAIVAIPNGGYRTRAEAARLKAEGVRAGMPDLWLPVARGGRFGLMLELKAAGGRLSAEQRDMLHRLDAEGYAAAVVWADWVLAWQVVERYLAGQAWQGVLMVKTAEQAKEKRA